MSTTEPRPTFMAPVVRYEAPAFNPADLLPDMAVIVIEPRHGKGSARAFQAKVVRKARVLITLEEIGRQDGQPKRWTMRLDTQRENGGTGNYTPYFRTLAQREYDVALSAAMVFLRGQGISIDHHGPWGRQEIELARLVWPGRKGSVDALDQ